MYLSIFVIDGSGSSEGRYCLEMTRCTAIATATATATTCDTISANLSYLSLLKTNNCHQKDAPNVFFSVQHILEMCLML